MNERICCDSPNAIELLLHCMCDPRPYEGLGVATFEEDIKRFVRLGLIRLEKGEGRERIYRTTGLGNAHVNNMCNLQFPRVAYVDEHGKVIRGVAIKEIGEMP